MNKLNFNKTDNKVMKKLNVICTISKLTFLQISYSEVVIFVLLIRNVENNCICH
jgi:hypothetical protein